MRLIYETHSTSTDNEAGAASGHNDPDLSPTGRLQAAELGNRRAADGIDVVYCLDLLRARRTAEIAFGDTGVPIRTDARLRECNFGEMNGHPVAEVHAASRDHVSNPFPDGESYTDVTRRVGAFLDDLRRENEARVVLVVAHRAPHHAIEHILNGHDLAELVTGAWEWQPGWEYELA
ncbi:MAG: histidine phosphatase family protein [Dehalococcoidia bacterium]